MTPFANGSKALAAALGSAVQPRAWAWVLVCLLALLGGFPGMAGTAELVHSPLPTGALEPVLLEAGIVIG